MYETFDHTADLGLRIRAPDLNTLFAEAGEALFAAIVEDLGTIEARQRLEIELSAEERDYLLFDWLKELLYQFDTEHFLFGRFDVRVTDSRLQATAWGERLDPPRHQLAHEVKAVTYHGLRLERTNDGWLAEVIVDI